MSPQQELTLPVQRKFGSAIDFGQRLKISYGAKSLFSRESGTPVRYQLRKLDEPASHTDIFHPNGTSENYRLRFPDLPMTMPVPEPSRETFLAIQKWEGYVTKVDKPRFWAVLTVLKGEGPEQIAELDFADVSSDDYELLIPGAVFYWNIGYTYRRSGVKKTSEIRFRRLPPLTSDEIQRIERKAERLERLFDDE
jgi:hypothetical protein